MFLEFTALGGAAAYLAARQRRPEKLIDKLLPPATEDRSWQSLKSLSTAKMGAEEKDARRFFRYTSTVLAASAVTAFVYPPFVWLLVPALLYGSYRLMKAGYDDLVKRRRVTVVVIDNLIGILGLAYGVVNPPYLVAAAFGNWLYAFMMKNIAIAKDMTHKRLAYLADELPQSVWRVKDGVEMELPLERVQIGDVLVVDAGGMIPADGVIQDGCARIDEHRLTGEWLPAEKIESDPVFAGTTLRSGRIYLRVEKTGADTAAARLGKLFEDTSEFTAAFELRGKALADKYAWPTIALSVLAYPVGGINSVLAILMAGPCYTMRLLGPVSVLNYLEKSAGRGILIKDGRALEQLSRVDTLLIDSSALLSEHLHVGGLYPCAGYTEEQLLRYAAAAEHHQTHPAANAILHAARERGVDFPLLDTMDDQGQGRKFLLDGRLIRVGGERFMAAEAVMIPGALRAQGKQAQTRIYVAVEEHLAGMLDIEPVLRPEAKDVVAAFQREGLTVHLVCRDPAGIAQDLAARVGIAEFFADASTEQNVQLINRLQAEGHSVCFVGDGIKDAVAMKTAPVAVSACGAATLSADTAPIILMERDPRQLRELFLLAQGFEKEMSRNLLTSTLPNVFTVIGTFTGVIGFASSIGMFYVGLAAGLTNVYLPKWRK
jgi:Cu2+-exporting ATPase